MAARKQVLEPGISRRKPRGESRAMRYAATRRLVLIALDHGAELDEACKAANVTRRQVQYYRENSPKFRAQYEAAKASGLVSRHMTPEKLKRFLAGCKWLCGIDVAREAQGLTKSELASCFEARPDIKTAALVAQAEGRKLYADENNEAATAAEWGRAELTRLVDKALTMEELT